MVAGVAAGVRSMPALNVDRPECVFAPFSSGMVAPDVPVVTPEDGSSVQLVSTPDAGVPNAGVTSVGDVANTAAPDPVSSVSAAFRLELDGVAKNADTLVPSPLTPVDIGKPVALVKVAKEGVPKLGVVSTGSVAKTANPVPVSSVSAAAKLAELGVPRKVATFVPSPLTPVDTGRPVALVRVAKDGTPKLGVVSTGDVAKTASPVPVSSVSAAAKLAELGVPRKVATLVPNAVSPVPPLAAARVPARVIVPEEVIGPPEVVSPVVPPETATLVTVPPLAPDTVDHVPSPRQYVEEEAEVPELRLLTGRLPVTPVERGKPVALVKVAKEGVPKLGVVSTGDVAKTASPVPVSSVSAAAKLAELGVPRKVATFVPSPLTPVDTGKPVALVRVAKEGTPKLGVVSTGSVAKTASPVPVSSEIAASKFAEVGVAKKVATFVPSPLTPVDTGKPVALVRVAKDGTPKLGVVSTGSVAKTRLPVPVLEVVPVPPLATGRGDAKVRDVRWVTTSTTLVPSA